jgi:uncharacterized protein (DUF58 family)
MAWGTPQKRWYATRAAGAIGYIALTGLDRVTVSALGNSSPNPVADFFPYHRGKQQALALFNFLESLNQNRSNGRGIANFNPSLALSAYANTRAGNGAVRPGSLLLFSDLMQDGWMEGLRSLATRGFEITVLHILAPEELNPELNGDLKLIDSEDQSAVEITADYDLLSRYKKGLADWQEELRHFCTSRNIVYAPISTAIPLDDLLFAWLEGQGVLR